MAIPSDVKAVSREYGKPGSAEPVSWLHYLVVLVSLIATIMAWQMSRTNIEDRAQLQFDREADEVIHLFEEQMRRYADVLQSGVGLVAGSGEILPEGWHEFTDRLALPERHPALVALGIAYRMKPSEVDAFERKQRTYRPEFTMRPAVGLEGASEQTYHLPLTHIAPRELESVVLGLDVARESRRRDAFDRALETGDVQISAPVQIDTSGDPAFVLFAPFYRKDGEGLFEGAVLGSIFSQQLAEGILDNDVRQVALKVSDGGEVMYNEQVAALADIDPEPLLTRSQDVELLGRVWRFDVHSTLPFRQVQSSQEPVLLLVGGLIINALLMYLLVQMTLQNRRALAFGERIARKYDKQTQALHQSNTALETLNEELRSFSYVVSHDLKTPLRGISALAECIREDLEDHLPADDEARPEFVRRLQLIRKQVTLSQGLITGVLEYSGLGADVEYPESVDVQELLASIRVMLRVDENRFRVQGDFPVINTYQTQLFQVFTNLIGNGYKYHGDEQAAEVTISTAPSPLTGFYRFVVSDNGPGIDPRYHEKIFEVFSTLQPKDHSMSSGVGLAIVKKLVQRHGGEILIKSEEGKGASFMFDWPVDAGQSSTIESAELPKAA